MTRPRRVPKTETINLVRLPPVGETGILLVDSKDETTRSLAYLEALEFIRKVEKNGRSLWVIVGEHPSR